VSGTTGASDGSSCASEQTRAVRTSSSRREPVPRSQPWATSPAARSVVDTGSIRLSVPSSSTEWDLGVYVGTDRMILAGGGPMLETSLGITTSEGWEADLEQNTALQSTIRVQATLFNGSAYAANLIVRLVAYAGEPFFRVYHTITWRVLWIDVKIIQFRFGLNVDSKYDQTSVGRLNAPWTGTLGTSVTKLQALQRDKSAAVGEDPRNLATTFHFQARVSGVLTVDDDDQTHAMSGAASLLDTVGNGYAVSLRDASEMYPSGFTFELGKLQLDLWPDAAGPGGFDYPDLVPGICTATRAGDRILDRTPTQSTNLIHYSRKQRRARRERTNSRFSSKRRQRHARPRKFMT